MQMRLNVSSVINTKAEVRQEDNSCGWTFSCVDGIEQDEIANKISKQSALAVQQLFRDNQHQSTGMFKFALA